MTRLARAAGRLTVGSRVYARRLGARAAAWCARGRRDDLSGWRGALGIFVRTALLLLGVYVLARIVRALPSLMWLLVSWWTIASWRAGKPAVGPPAKTPDEVPEESREGAPARPAADPQTVLILWLDHLTRDRPGIHLDELHQALARHPDLARLKRAEMRAWLDRHHITVDRTLRVGAVAGRSGVSRATIDALLKTLSPIAETSRVDSVVHAPGLHDSPVESDVESDGEPGVDPHFDDVVRLFA